MRRFTCLLLIATAVFWESNFSPEIPNLELSSTAYQLNQLMTQKLSPPSSIKRGTLTLRQQMYRLRSKSRLKGIRPWVKNVFLSSFLRPGTTGGKTTKRDSYGGWEIFRDIIIREERLYRLISQRHPHPIVYYPGFGREVIETLIATDFSILVGVEIEKDPEFVHLLTMITEGIDWQPTYKKKKKLILSLLDDYLEGNPAPHPAISKFREAIKIGNLEDFDSTRHALLGEISINYFENFQRMIKQQLSLLPDFYIRNVHFEKIEQRIFQAIFKWQGVERKIIVHYGKDAYLYFPSELLAGYHVLWLSQSGLGFIDIDGVRENLAPGGIVIATETLSPLPESFYGPYSLGQLGIREPSVDQLKLEEKERIFFKDNIVATAERILKRIEQDRWLTSPDVAELVQILGVLISEKNYRFESNPPEDYEGKLAWVEFPPSNKIVINEKFYWELSVDAVEPLVLHEICHLLKRQQQKIVLAQNLQARLNLASLSNELRNILGDQETIIEEEKENIKRAIAMGAQNEIEAYQLEFTYRSHQAQELGYQHLQTYLEALAKQATNERVQQHYKNLANNFVVLDQDFLRLFGGFYALSSYQQWMILHVASIEGLEHINPYEGIVGMDAITQSVFKRWLLSWLGNPAYYDYDIVPSHGLEEGAL